MARSPSKRLVGDRVTVSADIIADGHEVLAAELLWRADDEAEWHRVPMRLVDERSLGGAASCRRAIGRHRFTVRGMVGCLGHVPPRSVGQACRRAERDTGDRGGPAADRGGGRTGSGCTRGALPTIADRLASLDAAAQVALLLADDTARRCSAVDDRPFAVEHAPRFRSTSIGRRRDSPAGTRCSRAPPRTIPRGTAHSPM